MGRSLLSGVLRGRGGGVEVAVADPPDSAVIRRETTFFLNCEMKKNTFTRTFRSFFVANKL